jgi:hypothetical protein
LRNPICDVGRVELVFELDAELPAVDVPVALAWPIVTFLIVDPRSSNAVLMTSG